MQQADLRAQPLQMPHIQNAPENWEARRAVKVEEDENVCWTDLEGQPHKPSHMKAEPFNVVVKWQKVEQERAD